MIVAALGENERLDDLIIGDYKIVQHTEEFCFAIDAVLLGHFATVRQTDQVVDLGSGSGVLGFIMLHRGAAMVRGIELNTRMAELSGRSIELNRESSRFSVQHGDYRKIRELLPAESASLVITNPPYRLAGSGKLSSKPGVAMAKHELTADYRDAVRAAAWLLPTGGKLALSHLPERLPEILAYMLETGIVPKRMRLVYTTAGNSAAIVLLEGVRGARSGGFIVEPPLYIYDENGKYSPEVQSYYGKK